MMRPSKRDSIVPLLELGADPPRHRAPFSSRLQSPAAVAELVDARRSGRRVRKDVGVRLPPAASTPHPPPGAVGCQSIPRPGPPAVEEDLARPPRRPVRVSLPAIATAEREIPSEHAADPRRSRPSRRRSPGVASGWNWRPRLPAEAERGGAGGRAGELLGTARQAELVVVEVEPRAGRDLLGPVGLDLEPADLGRVGRGDPGTGGRGQRLAAEAEAEHRDVGVEGLPQEADLLVDPGGGIRLAG